MNLIKRLFGRGLKAGNARSHAWPGQSGKEYPYQIHPLGTDFKPEPANYILCSAGEGGAWSPLYIAQTRDVHQRLEGSESQEHAIQQGATHIHVHLSSASHAARCTEERDLILRWHPICNETVDG